MATQYIVTARAAGHYGKHRRPGESFSLDRREDFAAGWMRAVGWEPSGQEAAPEPVSDPTALQLHGRVTTLEKELAEEKALAEALVADMTEKVAVLEEALRSYEGVCDAIRAELIKVAGLPADLNLAEAVAWMADRLSAPSTAGAARTTAEGGSTAKARPNSKKE